MPSLVQFVAHEGNIANGPMRYIRAECRSCFDHADFSAENIACGLSTDSMKRRAGDGRRRTIIYINTARIEVPFMWGSLRLAPITNLQSSCLHQKWLG